MAVGKFLHMDLGLVGFLGGRMMVRLVLFSGGVYGG